MMSILDRQEIHSSFKSKFGRNKHSLFKFNNVT